MDTTSLIYDAAFLSLGSVILAQPIRVSSFPLAPLLWLLGVSAVLHGISGWFYSAHTVHGWGATVGSIGVGVEMASFIFLFEFGRRTVLLVAPRFGRHAGISRHVLQLPVYVVLVGGVVLGGLLHSDPWRGLSIWGRYLLCAPGALLSGIGFVLYYFSDAPRLAKLRIQTHFVLAVIAFLVFGVATVFALPHADLFSANLLNAEVSLATLHAPLMLIHAASAVLATVAIVNILRVFRLNEVEQLEIALEQVQVVEARFRGLVESSSDWIWEVDALGVYTYVSPHVQKLLGYRPEEVLGKTPFDLMLPDEAKRVEAAFAEISAARQPFFGLESTCRRKDGRLVVLETSGVPFFDLTGKLLGYRGMNRDITARQHKDMALRESEAKYRTLLETIPQVIFVKNRESVYVSCNRNYARALGIEPDAIVGKTDFDFHPRELAERYRRDDRRIMEKGVTEDIIEPYVLGGSEELTAHTVKTPIRDEHGTVIGLLGIFFDITEQKKSEDELRRSQTNLAEAQQLAHLGSWEWDVVRNTLSWSDEMFRIFGLSPQQFGASYEAFAQAVHPDDRERVQLAVNAALEGRNAYDIEFRSLHPNGVVRMVHARGVVTRDERDGSPVRMVGTVQDITEWKHIEARLRQASTVFENTSEGVVITGPDQRIQAINAAFTTITGYREEEVLGNTPRMLQSGRHDAEFYRGMWAALHANGRWQGEVWNRRKDGATYPEWLNISAVRDEMNRVANYIAVFSDITTIKHAQDRVEYLASHDALTGLPNRVLFRDRLEQVLARARRHDQSIALLFIDLDRFKLVNDTLGHETGDRLLQEVARRLLACARAEDTVARMGGDEFVVIQEDVKKPEDAAMLATRLLQQMNAPVSLQGHEVIVTLSVGISLYPRDGEDIGTLVKNADVAMYRAKETGRNCYQFYDDGLARAGLDRLELENDLRLAIDRGELVLHYQPQVEVKTGVIVGVEALARWNHPRRGMVSPGTFIPVAEEIGLIDIIGSWVLDTACSDAKGWRDAGLPPVRVAVNVSGRQIGHDHVAEKVADALRTSGCDAQCLEIEVTESILMTNTERAIATLTALKKLGVTLAIDDFGTGYSSLSYLKRFPIDKIKIDKSFVDGLPNDADDAALTRTIIAMAHGLKRTVIAEGVETEAQLAFLREHDCEEMQGYLFSKPVPAPEIARMLRAFDREPALAKPS